MNVEPFWEKAHVYPDGTKSPSDTVKLDMGGGDYPREGFLNVDINAASHPDILAPMWAVPLPDNSVEEIWSSHSLEHVTRHQVVNVLTEWKRLLIPGAVARIEVPDLVWVCQNWLYRRSNDWHMDTIFGQQTNEGEAHRSGYTPEIMQEYVDKAGMRIIEFKRVDSHGQPSLSFTVQKV